MEKTHLKNKTAHGVVEAPETASKTGLPKRINLLEQVDYTTSGQALQVIPRRFFYGENYENKIR